jgi:hypothetical protein
MAIYDYNWDKYGFSHSVKHTPFVPWGAGGFFVEKKWFREVEDV